VRKREREGGSGIEGLEERKEREKVKN